MATWIYLVRHGQTVWNEEGRLCGSSDVPLSDEGLAQARKLAARLKDIDITAIYSSPLLRARQTAEAIAACHCVEVKVEPDLREIDYGDWEGLKVVDAAERFPELEKLRREDPMRFAAPNGEPMQLFAERVISAIQRIAASHADETVCVVAHQTVNRFILCWILQSPHLADFRFWRQLRQDPACVNLLQVREDGMWRVCLVNDICHLMEG
ncbi:histidine phosphatase family protein [Fervidibacter sacchari]|uniref:Broad specificity phosphatase PhoE n=1 Tax=Candidatus Fervidibacter sacchari TaxID=1448929 RepID=A0ABT2EJ91_9BACT|nr:histidine phosphatase family protein [Candidatus Fervidibacter sacchari]MCS3917997.1 broad specificity phosphatase PhoE [Candidatus Fervidibacter sacchari]WKU15812.1 histidine phosphatase family protein [Candidatus Fervidibacter sacchari]